MAGGRNSKKDFTITEVKRAGKKNNQNTHTKKNKPRRPQ